MKRTSGKRLLFLLPLLLLTSCDTQVTSLNPASSSTAPETQDSSTTSSSGTSSTSSPTESSSTGGEAEEGISLDGIRQLGKKDLTLYIDTQYIPESTGTAEPISYVENQYTDGLFLTTDLEAEEPVTEYYYANEDNSLYDSNFNPSYVGQVSYDHIGIDNKPTADFLYTSFIGGVIQPLLFEDVYSNPFKAFSEYEGDIADILEIEETENGAILHLKEAYRSLPEFCKVSSKINGFFLNDYFDPVYVEIDIEVSKDGTPMTATITTPLNFLSYGVWFKGTYVNYIQIAFPDSVEKPTLEGLYPDASSEGLPNHELALALEKLGEAYEGGNYTQNVNYDGSRKTQYQNIVDMEEDILLCTNTICAYDKTYATDGSDAYVEASKGAYTAIANRFHDDSANQDCYSLYAYYLQRDERYFGTSHLEMKSGNSVNRLGKLELNPGDLSADFFAKTDENSYVFDLDSAGDLQNEDGFSDMIKMAFFPVCDNIFQYLLTESVSPTEMGLYTYSNNRNYTTATIHSITVNLDDEGEVDTIVLDITNDNDGYGNAGKATVTLSYSDIGTTDLENTGNENITDFVQGLKEWAIKD